jgi:hypothetical protein
VQQNILGESDGHGHGSATATATARTKPRPGHGHGHGRLRLQGSQGFPMFQFHGAQSHLSAPKFDINMVIAPTPQPAVSVASICTRRPIQLCPDHHRKIDVHAAIIIFARAKNGTVMETIPVVDNPSESWILRHRSAISQNNNFSRNSLTHSLTRSATARPRP